MFVKKFFTPFLCSMEFKQATAQECASDFIANVWPLLFKGGRGSKNREWARVRAFVNKARSGEASPEYIAKYLAEFGGGRYEIETTFSIEI